jgi:LCCL domain
MSRRDRASIIAGVIIAIGLVVFPLAHRLSKPDAGGVAGIASPVVPSDANPAGGAGASTAPDPTFVPDPTPTPIPTARASWAATAMDLRLRLGESFEYGCTPNGTFGDIWGTDIYTDDSSVCTAAVHRGLITREDGGSVTIVIRPAMASYTGSKRNGVTTLAYGPWEGSFEVLDP